MCVFCLLTNVKRAKELLLWAAGNAKFNCSAHYGGAQFGGIGGSLSGQGNGTNTIGSY